VTAAIDMYGKVCLVTGATSGLGRVTARELARLRAVVIGVGRHSGKCLEAAKTLRQETRNPNIEFLLADLSSQKAIRQLAEEFRRRYPRLDVLVNNVGAAFLQRRETPERLEMTLGLNHFGQFLLTRLLLETLKASAQPGASARIINVASSEHARLASLNFSDLQSRKNYNPLTAYRRSKLANVLFTYELARRLVGTHVNVNAVHPGLVATNLWANNGQVGRLARWAMNRVAVRPEVGAGPILYLATSPLVESVSGKYFNNNLQAVSSSKASYDQATQLRLWLLSEQLTGLAADED
jgi:NAD(P)-dependent dehydrogenase (short-subunit alcohol dehydrogenase family)